MPTKPQGIQSPSQLLATLILGEPVGEWIARRRVEGATVRVISRELYDRTDGQLDVTEKTLRDWEKAAA